MMKPVIMSTLALLASFSASLSASAAPVPLERCDFDNGSLVIESPAPGKILGEVRMGGQVRLRSEVVEIRNWRSDEIDELLAQTTAREVARHLGLDTRRIHMARTHEINPSGNHDDASGALLVLFQGRVGEFLGRGAQLGWGVVTCR